jgi:hypothetical protein
MIGLREVVFNLIKTDPAIIALGYGPGSLFGNSSPDSPTTPRFATIVWGEEIRALGSRRAGDRLAKERSVALWAYDRDRDYGAINKAIERWCVLMDTLPTMNTGAGSVIGADWVGNSPETYDDGYQRIVRYSTYTINGTGE